MKLTATNRERIIDILSPIGTDEQIDSYIEDLETSLWTNRELAEFTADELIDSFNDFLDYFAD